jgi:hypothetical protein
MPWLTRPGVDLERYRQPQTLCFEHQRGGFRRLGVNATEFDAVNIQHQIGRSIGL